MKGAMWWIDRWRQSRAFTDMTAEEQGLYRNLCDEIWLREDHAIPDDPRILSRVSGDPEAWARCGAKVLRWMRKVEGGWTNDVALEVIEQAQRRAEKQRRYRAHVGNAGGNGIGNKAGSPSPSPSPSLTYERTNAGDPPARADAVRELRKAGADLEALPSRRSAPNPLVGDRPEREREALRLVARLAEINGTDPAEEFADAAHYKGAERRKCNPAAMSDDRLLNTLMDLRANVKTAEARIESKRLEAAKRERAERLQA